MVQLQHCLPNFGKVGYKGLDHVHTKQAAAFLGSTCQEPFGKS